MESSAARLISSPVIPLVLAVGVAGLLFSQTRDEPAQNGAAARDGSFQKIKVHGKSLEGNLEGDSPDRDVYVYLPPSYKTDTSRRYPVVYFLHGYGATAELYWNLMKVPQTADHDVAAGTAREMILVHPDAHTLYDGSMYSNSPTTGNWEAFITHDLVNYIDSHYRTIANRDSRGLAGHSMGGYGTFRIGMKYPQVYSAIYAMSSCCLMNNPGAGRGRAPQAAKQPPPPAARGSNGRGRGPGRNVFANVISAEAAAWSPDPMNPPKFFDLPTEDGKPRPEIVAKWIANSPLAMVDQYVPNLKMYKAIMMDVGLQDGLLGSNREMDASLTQLGVTHTFETYEGTHMSRVPQRFEGQVLPFFSQHLSFTAEHQRHGKKH
jgi:enterochelin esterase-like enzyme